MLAGYYGVNSSFVTVGATVGNGVQLLVYKDNAGGTVFTNTFTGTCAPTATLNFNHNVGQLQVGDIIYISIGPNTTDGSDSFSSTTASSSIPRSIRCNSTDIFRLGCHLRKMLAVTAFS